MADTSKWKWESHNTDWKNGLFPWGTPGNVINLFGRIVTGDCERHHYCGYFLVDPHYLQRRCRDVPEVEFWAAWKNLVALPFIGFDPEHGILLIEPLWARWVAKRSGNISNFAGLVKSISGTLKHIQFNPDDPLVFPFKSLLWPTIEKIYEFHEEEQGSQKYGHIWDIEGELENAIDSMGGDVSEPVVEPVVGPVVKPVVEPLKSESPKSLNLKNPKSSKAHSRVDPLPGLETAQVIVDLEMVHQNGGMKAAWKFIEVQDRDQKDALTEHLKKLE